MIRRLVCRSGCSVARLLDQGARNNWYGVLGSPAARAEKVGSVRLDWNPRAVGAAAAPGQGIDQTPRRDREQRGRIGQ